jgi:hypothetical protein
MPMQEYGAYQAPAKKKVIKKRSEDMGRGKKVAVAKKKVAPKSGYMGVDYKVKPKASSGRQEDMGRNPYKASGGKRQEDMSRKPGNLRPEDMGRRSAPAAKRTGYVVPKQPKRAVGSKRQEDMGRPRANPRPQR